MIYLCSTCKEKFTDRASSLVHIQEQPDHFIGGVVTKAEPIEPKEVNIDSPTA